MIILDKNSQVRGDANVSSAWLGLNLCNSSGLNLTNEMTLWSIPLALAHSNQASF